MYVYAYTLIHVFLGPLGFRRRDESEAIVYFQKLAAGCLEPRLTRETGNQNRTIVSEYHLFDPSFLFTGRFFFCFLV